MSWSCRLGLGKKKQKNNNNFVQHCSIFHTHYVPVHSVDDDDCLVIMYVGTCFRASYAKLSKLEKFKYARDRLNRSQQFSRGTYCQTRLKLLLCEFVEKEPKRSCTLSKGDGHLRKRRLKMNPPKFMASRGTIRFDAVGLQFGHGTAVIWSIFPNM